MSRTNKCLRPTCGCPVTEGEKYCSILCEDAGASAEVPCNCGHRGCVLEAVAKADKQMTPE